DTNCDIYPVKEGERLTFVIASTLDLSGKPDDGTYKPLGDEVSLADKYEYVMHGRVYRFDQQKDTKVQVRKSPNVDMERSYGMTILYSDIRGLSMYGNRECVVISSTCLFRSPVPPVTGRRRNLFVPHLFVVFGWPGRVGKVFASFGGLLMRLTGDQRHVANIEVDSRVFCLLRRNA
ncbi:unnamed protein product, partial [Ectocarpus sp. 13 AM-2016]